MSCQPKSFQIFLSGCAGVGKSFLIKVITKYLKRVLRYPYQNLDQLSVLVTESDEKAPQYKKPSDDTLHMLRNKYQYLKVLIIDEISKIG